MERQIFEDIVHLLQGVDWLYNYPMTQVFTRNIFNHMPVEWQGALVDLPLDALNGLPQCITMQHWPQSLQKFLKECDRLSYLSEDLGPQSSCMSNTSTRNTTTFSTGIAGNSNRSSTIQIPQELTLGMTAKKKHEITTLLCVVKKMLDLTGSRHILDVGSGKGYIDSCIHKILCSQVCGVEGNKKLIRSAERHHWKLYGRCRGINFLNWHLSDNVETVCRVGQLISYISELDPTCSCQTKYEARALRAKGASKSLNIIGRGESLALCENAAVNTEGRNSPYSQGESDIPSSCGNMDPENPCTLLGLHACADLSPIIIKVFRDCSQASSLVLLSCCYHKMSVQPTVADRHVNDDHELTPKSSDGLEEDAECSHHRKSPSPKAKGGHMSVNQESISKNRDDLEEHSECSVERDPAENEGSFASEGDGFVNFPMSQSLQDIFRQNNFHMSVFGLRLGAQECGQKWRTETLEDHEYHMRNVAYRGVLEAACIEEGFILQKLRRRCARKASFKDFSEYKKDIFENYEFHRVTSGSETLSTISSFPSEDQTQNSYELKNETENSHISTALDSCYENYKHYFPLIEPLTGLQLALQPVIEMMVQVDRLTYLKECGFSKVWLEKVFDPEVSPRNIALLAVR